MIKIPTHRLLILITLLFFSFTAGATLIIPSKATLRETGGTPVAVGDVASVSAPSDGATFIDYTKKGLITLAVDHHYPTAVAEGHTTVELEITTYDVVGGSPNTPFNITLEVDYTPGSTLSFNDRQIYELDGILAYDIEILTINGSGSADLPLNLYIDAEMFINRIYDFSDILDDEVDVDVFDSSKILDRDCDEVKDDLLVKWQPITEAEEYQLEWTYVNDYTGIDGTYMHPDDVAFDFRFNSSRITTADLEYAIPLTYDHGYVIYRVRAVGRLMSDPTKRQYSLWSLPQKGFVDPDAGDDFYHIEDAWEISKNWQYSVTFAEEGKKKEVVSFFDGSLRNRQMVTLISTNNKAIVGETIYDHQGRPAIQVLPTPVSQPDHCTDGNNTLKYYEDFNKSEVTSREYKRTDFDLSDTLAPCTAAAAKMSTESGASHYYSSDNLETTGAQGYLPDAAKYPFSQVEYTPDNTGRIRRQGGVGETFQLNGEHESKYFYGHPEQIELDRLFGSEVGYAKHYQKNMVIDPNGQVSVSYLDQEGRVIATSLAGESPENVIALESSVDAEVNLTSYMLSKFNQTANTLSNDGLSETINQTVLISSPTDVVLNYNLDVTMFTDSCFADGICFGCVYDLTIDFKDECGASLMPDGTIHTMTGQFEQEEDSISFTIHCGETELNGMPYSATIENVQVGSYQLTKTLTLNEEALAFYEQEYLDSTVNTCFKTLADFQDEYLANADFSGCDIDTSCQQCLDNLPSLDDFLDGDYGTEADYQLLLDNCSALCEPVSMYKSFRSFLMMDMNPGGQYGEYLTPSGTVQPSNFALSVYYTDNSLPRSYYSPGALAPGIGDWQRPVYETYNSSGVLVTANSYFDEDLLTESKVRVDATLSGPTVISTDPATVDPALVYLDAEGYYTAAENLANVEDFIDNFQPSWSASLILYHPEYRILETYHQLTVKDLYDNSSESFDALMDQTDTWDAALTAGLIVSNAPANYAAATLAHAYDPFLVGMVDSDHWSYYQALLVSKMANYATVGTARSMAEIAAMTARCDNQFSPSSNCFAFGTDASGPGYGGGSLADIAARNADWVNFKSFYKSLKQQYISELSIERSIESSAYYGYNGCIGNSNFNPFDGGFFDVFGAGSGSQYLNPSQPCYVDNVPLYQPKVKRFILPSDVVAMAGGLGSGTGSGTSSGGTTYSTDPTTLWNASSYAMYVNTGNCPLSIGLANLASNLTSTENFTSSSYGLNGSAAFPGFIQAYSGITNPPTALPVMTWSASIVNDSTVNVTITDATPSTIATIVWKMHQDSLVNWDSINGITDLHAYATGGLGYQFTGKAVDVHGDTIDYYPLFGSTSLDILNCTFPDVCERTELGNNLFDLLNVIAGSGNFASSPYKIKGTGSDPLIEPFVTDDIAEIMSGTSTPADSVFWGGVSGGLGFSIPGLLPPPASRTIVLGITNLTPGLISALPNIVGFSDMITTGENTFTLIGVDNTGAVIASIDISASIHVGKFAVDSLPTGSCEQPQSGCTDLANVNFDELKALLTDILINQDPNYDLAASPMMTPNLLGQMDSLTTSTTDTIYSGLLSEPLTFDYETIDTLEDGTTITQNYYHVFVGARCTYFVYKDVTVCPPAETGEDCSTSELIQVSRTLDTLCERAYETTFHFGPDCDLTLDLRDDPIKHYQLSDITSVLSFSVTGDPDINGNYHQFEMVVKFGNPVIGEKTDTVFGTICLPIRPCTEITTTFNGAEPFPTVVITDPCVAIVTSLAYAAAEDAYNDYVDSLLTDFRARYIAHCMSGLETFSRNYNQSEYHFTLYYYDQAGNLVKTVPPEGVEQLDITSSTDDLSVDIREDRDFGTHTIITNHRMGTLYAYNSLNQLVAQHMPDQDDVSSWSQTLTNGLDVNLTTTAIQMLSSSIGYLTGYVTTSNAPTGSRGYLYRTTDGGNNWTRITNLFPYDLLKVEMVNSTVGFAVGKSGVALKTVDGGTTWDLMNMHSKGIIGDFVDVAAQDGTNAAFLMPNGHIIPYISGSLGTEYTPSSPSVPTGAASISLNSGYSIEYNGSSNVYSVNLEFSTGSPVTYFTQMALVNISTPATSYEAINGSDWNHIVFPSSTFGIVSGPDGDLALLTEKNTSGIGTQYLQSSNIVGEILESAFIDKTIGVALVNDGGTKYVYKTADGGINWNKISTYAANSIGVVEQASHDLFLVVSYTNDSVFYYDIGASTNTLLWKKWVNTDFDKMAGYINGSQYFYFGTVGNVIMKSSAFTQTGTTPPTPVTYATVSTASSFSTIKTVKVSTTAHVLTVDNINEVYDSWAVGTGAATNTRIGLSSGKYTDIAVGTNGGTYALAYNDATRKIYRSILGTTTAPAALAAVGSSATTISSGIIFVAMAIHANYVSLVSTKGIVYSSDTTVSSTSSYDLGWVDRSDMRISPIRSMSKINFPFTSPTNNAVAVGDRGVVLKRSTSNLWTVAPLGLTVNPSGSAVITPQLNASEAATISSVPYVLFAGQGAIAKRWNLNTNALTDFTTGTFTAGSVPNFLGIACNTSGNAAITSSGSKVYYYTNFVSSPTSVSTITTGTDVLNAVSFPAGSSTVIAVGNGGRVATVSSSTYTILNGIYGPGLNTVHFASTNLGTIAGDNFFVRATSNAGSQWGRVLPATVNSTTLTNTVSKTWTRATSASTHFAILGGNSYMAYSFNNVATPAVGFTPTSVNAIAFSEYNPNIGYFSVGTALKKIQLTATGSGPTATYTSAITAVGLVASISHPMFTINAIHVFTNGTNVSELMLVGNNMIQYKPEGFPPLGSTVTSMLGGVAGNIRDVVFTDREHGYVVGDAGLFYETDAITYNTAGTAYTAMSWVQKDVHDSYSGALSNINIAAVEFPTATQGIWGGSYVTSPGSGYAAVRILGVQNQNYSAHFYYDRLGRIVVSQNSRQKGEDKYSYTLYDALGRVYEAGEKTENTAGGGATFFAGIFGTSVGGQYVASVIDDAKLNTWLTEQSTSTRKEVSRSYYDRTNIAINTSGVGAEHAFNLATQRKRIVHVTYEAVYDDDDGTYDHATHYDYDIHGNVKTLLQDNPKLGALADLSQHRFKQFDYVYDLISGNVHRVDYETGEADQWHHAYTYDADNRITEVYTTTKTPLSNPNYGVLALMMEPTISTYWTKEAEYQYYDHGPLARTVLGEHEVQGLDYVYTLQGWIKGVNSNDLVSSDDPGEDSDGMSSNHIVAQDVMGYSLHYYDGDYRSVTGNDAFIADQTSSDLADPSHSMSLYNGNIGRMVTTITNPDTRDILPLGTAYRYDQLNRLKEAISFTNMSSNAWGTGQAGIYGNKFTYDANGNITSQLRKDSVGSTIDSLVYKYHQLSNGKTIQNRLYHVDDNVLSGKYGTDIDDMGTFVSGGTINTANNYSYDAEGRLIKDVQEEINIIDWRVDGKVKSITRIHGSEKKNLTFDYDAMGHRIAKHITNNAFVLEKSTYYILDAQGNTMATYDRVIGEEDIAFTQTEKHIYGSSRIGISNEKLPMLGHENNNDIVDRAVPVDEVDTADIGVQCSFTGKWSYESPGVTGTASHNILTFVDNNSPTDNFVSVQLTANVVEGETYTLSYDVSDQTNLSTFSTIIYKCGVSVILGGQDIYANGSYQYTFTVPAGWNKIRIKWWGIENTSGTPMSFSLSSVGLDGAGVQFSDDEEPTEEPTWTDVVGKRNYELTNHLGNVLSVISDKPIPYSAGYTDVPVAYYLADIRQATDYSPFGVQLTGRNFILSGVTKQFRYGYQNSEQDDEIKGDGNSYSTEYRFLDPRLGRWLTMDPLTKHDFSPYTSMSDNPITMIDPRGDDDYFNTKGEYLYSDKKSTNYIVIKGTTSTKLQDYVFNENNAFALAKIGRYYAKKGDVKISDLKKGCLSVGNRYWKDVAGQIEAYGQSWFNEGEVALKTDLANWNEEKNTISLSLDEGKISEYIKTGWELMNVLVHERAHKDSKETDEVREHIGVYLKQVQHSSWQKCCKEFKDMHIEQIKNYYNKLVPGEDWSQAGKDELTKFKSEMKTSFAKEGIKLE